MKSRIFLMGVLFMCAPHMSIFPMDACTARLSLLWCCVGCTIGSFIGRGRQEEKQKEEVSFLATYQDPFEYAFIMSRGEKVNQRTFAQLKAAFFTIASQNNTPVHPDAFRGFLQGKSVPSDLALPIHDIDPYRAAYDGYVARKSLHNVCNLTDEALFFYRYSHEYLVALFFTMYEAQLSFATPEYYATFLEVVSTSVPFALRCTSGVGKDN